MKDSKKKKSVFSELIKSSGFKKVKEDAEKKEITD